MRSLLHRLAARTRDLAGRLFTPQALRCMDAPPGGAGGPRGDPFDAAYCRTLETRVLAPIFQHWFRPRFIGTDRIPREGPVILAANHSGMAFPFDGMVLDACLWREEGMQPSTKMRSVYDKELTIPWWMRPFGVDDFWRRVGGVDMTFDNFERLLERGDRVIYYPEGVPGIGKGFAHRYRLQRYSRSFVLLAARYDVPIYPVYIVNGEWVNPFSFSVRWLDRLVQRLFLVPFFPLPLVLLGILMPWFWWFAFPAHMVFVVGEPLDARALLRARGVTSFAVVDRGLLVSAAEEVRQQMQRELARLVALYGRHPYGLRSLARHLRRARREGQLWRAIPVGWPATFQRHYRDHFRQPARSRLHAIVRDLDLVLYYLPLGWPMISVTRALRRPPYGHRGLSAEERRALEGSYVWRLAERPLPARAPRGAARSEGAGAADAAEAASTAPRPTPRAPTSPPRAAPPATAYAPERR